jgi:GTP-binding protein
MRGALLLGMLDTMKVKTAEFLLGAANLEQLPRAGLPEIALAGRSNVGKSSLLNRLTGQKGLARISKTPGKTRELNLYRLNGNLLLVDLPGYGFAKVPDVVRRQWGKLVETYLNSRDELHGIVHLVDARHTPSPDDVQMQEWIAHYRVPALIAVTKADKIPKDRRAQALATIRETLRPEAETPVVFFSAVTGEGAREVWDWILRASGLA